MPDDLPEIGLSAGIENLDKFAQDAKKVQDSYRQMAEAEAQVQKASEQQVAATEQAGQAWVATAAQANAAAAAWADAAAVMTDAQKATGAQAEEVETAEQAWEGLFAQFGAIKDRAGAVAQGQADLIKSMEQGSRSAVTTEKAYAVLEDAYQRIAQRDGPEVVQALREMEQEFLDAGGTVEKWSMQVQDAAGGAADGLVDAADEASSAWENMAALLSLGALQQVAGTVGRAGDQLLGLAKGAVMTAARIEELDAVLGNLAVQNDLTGEALRNQVEAVKAQGIQSSVAYNLVTQFVQANLDLEKASVLARVAQDAAVISMEDSSQALAGMLHGIMTLQPEVLRYRGIIIDLQGDYQRWAEANNRTVQSMTGAEKQLVALDSVIAEGVKLTGTYESAMGTASKQMRSFSRYTEELNEEFGNSLLPVLTEGVFIAKDLVKAVGELPEPFKASLAASGALTGAILKGTSSMVGMGSQVAMLAFSMKELGWAAQGTTLAMLGPVGLVAALTAVVGVGVYSALKAGEEAHRAEAAAIIAATDSYEDYVRRAKDAELGSYTLSESLYEVAKGADAAKVGIDALTLTEAFRDLDFIIGGAVTGVKEIDDIFRKVGPRAGHTLEMWRLNLIDLVEALDDTHLYILQDEEAVRKLGASANYSGDQLELYVQTVMDTAREQIALRDAADAVQYSMATLGTTFKDGEVVIERYSGNMVNLAEVMLNTATVQRDLREAMTEMMQAAMDADPAVEQLTYQIMKLIEETGSEGGAIQWSIQRLADIARDAEEDIANLRDRARDDEEKAQSRYFASLEKLEQDHAKRRADIQADIAEVHQDLLDDMAKAEEDYQADRLQLAEDYAQDIADAEAKLAQDRADLNADLLKDLADAERDYAQDVVDAQEDLARDFEDIQRKLQAKLLDLEAEAYKAREELAVEYGDKLKSITEKYASEAESIAKKYSTEPEPPTFDDQREALQQELKDLEEQNKGRMFINRGREDQLRRQLKDLMDAELEALEERKQAELTELAAWLDEEQRVQDDAYQEAIDKQIAAAVAQAEERLLQYGRQLEDLEKALGQEKEELNRRYNERLADLEQAHSRQLEEMKRAHEEQLAAMDVQLAQEKVRLAEAAQQRRDSLAEQLADEQVAYRDRKKALDEALVDEKDTITTRLGEQSQIVTDKALEMTKNMADAWDKIDPAVANALRMVTYNTIIPWVNSVLDEIRRMKTGIEHELDSSPISGWFLGVGKSMGRGLEQGFDLKGILGAQIDELSQFKVQAEGVLEVGSPSKWASRLGENVTESFGDKAVLEPSIGSFAMDAFESDIPSVPGQDMALDPFLTGMPDIPSQEMAITPYLLDVQALAEQSQVQAPTPPMMAAGGMGGGSTMNRINNVQFDAHYKRYESERSLRDHIDLLRIGMRW